MAAAMKKAGKLSGIPFDLTREILLRLPARSVVRFRLACKLWHSETLDPDFVEAHLDLARKVSPPSILLAPYYYEHVSYSEDKGHDFTILEGGDNTWTPKQRFSSRLKRGGGGEKTCFEKTWFHGSCNGIICISDDADDYKICTSEDTPTYKIIQLLNPATGDSLTLPKTPTFYRAFFGFHPVTKEYKVAVVDSITCETTEMPRCQVYTIGTDTSWRDIDAILGFEPFQATLLNGVIFSISCEPITTSIVSFDLKDESFKRFPLMDFREEYDPNSIYIVELQGSVCVYLKFTADERMEVWRLTTDDSGGIDKHGWTLLYSILPWGGMDPISPLFIHKDKILTMSHHNKKYHVENEDGIYDMPCYRYVKKDNVGVNEIIYMHKVCYHAHVHVESLIALPNMIRNCFSNGISD